MQVRKDMGSSSENVADPTAKYWIHRWEHRPMPFEIAVITSVFSGLLGVLAALANGLVVYLIIQIKRFHQQEHLDILVLSLCFSDFLSSVVVQPVLIPCMLANSHVSALYTRISFTPQHILLLSWDL